MEQLLLKKRIYQVPIQPQNFEQWQDDLELKRTRWGKYFNKQEEFEFFAMLPLNDEQRVILLASMIEEAKFNNELKCCEGKTGSSQEHRQKCVKCVLTEKASIAQPMFT
jgi:hypothetical protein